MFLFISILFTFLLKRTFVDFFNFKGDTWFSFIVELFIEGLFLEELFKRCWDDIMFNR